MNRTAKRLLSLHGAVRQREMEWYRGLIYASSNRGVEAWATNTADLQAHGVPWMLHAVGLTVGYVRDTNTNNGGKRYSPSRNTLFTIRCKEFRIHLSKGTVTPEFYILLMSADSANAFQREIGNRKHSSQVQIPQNHTQAMHLRKCT